jgi:quercetin dioxygenase-like cupin family protein
MEAQSDGMDQGAGTMGTGTDGSEGERPVSSFKISVSHLQDDSWGARGRRSFFDYRDLGIGDATNGEYGFHVVRAKPGEPATTNWHFHTCSVQVVYCLNGWEDLKFEDGQSVRLVPGSCLNIPPGAGHIEVSYSPDMEVLVFSSPAQIGTTPIPSPLDD